MNAGIGVDVDVDASLDANVDLGSGDVSADAFIGADLTIG